MEMDDKGKVQIKGKAIKMEILLKKKSKYLRS